MDDRTHKLPQENMLRRRAEAELQVTSEKLAAMSESDVLRLVHELQVHQIELRMQNEDLREAQSALEQSRDRYNNLFDFAPVGYLTLDDRQHIRESNLTMSTQLGIERDNLVGRRFSDFVVPESQDLLHLEWRAALETGRRQMELELELHRGDGSRMCAQITCVKEPDFDSDYDTITYRCAVTDITFRREVEALRREKEMELEYLAHHDMLTGLANRVMFQQRVTHVLTRARRQKRDIALLYLDLDGFKQINDSFGHEMGDRLLVLVAQRLRTCVREEDILARLGGDEFGIVLEEVSEPWGAPRVADKVIEALRVPFVIEDRELVLGISVGVCLFPADSTDASELIRNADIAMYQAKRRGGNAVHFYTPALTEAVHLRVSTESALRRAIDGGELEVHYQPMMELATGRIVGAEVLLRWRDSCRGLLLPDTFLPIAELSDLIVQVGNQVIHLVCAQIAAWRARSLVTPRLSVNISARQCMSDEIVTMLRQALEHYAVPPLALELEITESCCLDKVAIGTVLPMLKTLGVSLTIDDFGTGYASLTSLRNLPITSIKIDRSFVAEIAHASGDGAIARAVVALGRSQGLRVIAEGVEETRQLDALRKMGCDVCQGYLIAPPMPAEEYIQWLQDNACMNQTPT
ncbi:GGDEF and EAL domain-containing protein [Accumulibacter sp.]|uniref:putative bifunctional diguanylate cyclase/phosphodiesterase n=1 Tax=Accumulibacter sp. TaxID=2053492 RepID=UPI001AC5B6F3|nr:GGDEF and EAL domain-containing protein [Accumulibacter sp.]MBN8520222.1 EAL domain-containing protein [Accumulibacter sp.]